MADITTLLGGATELVPQVGAGAGPVGSRALADCQLQPVDRPVMLETVPLLVWICRVKVATPVAGPAAPSGSVAAKVGLASRHSNTCIWLLACRERKNEAAKARRATGKVLFITFIVFGSGKRKSAASGLCPGKAAKDSSVSFIVTSLQGRQGR